MVAYLGVLYYFCFVAFLFRDVTNSERTKDKMYESIKGAAACFRRLNGTHQFGCSSSRNGNVGVIHSVKTIEDLNWLIEKSTAGPYMVVLPPDMFNRPVLKSLQISDKVSGVVLADIKRPTDYSPDDVCPNRYSGLSSFTSQTCNDIEPVNPWGSSLLLEDWGFPLFHIADNETLDSIDKCFSRHNSELTDQDSRALCSLEMNSYMFAAVDSETCYRRTNMMTNFKPIHFCDPLGDQNVWSTLFPRTKQNDSAGANSTLIVLAARMDSTSMFDWLAPGAVTPTTGIVTLLSTAEILSRMISQDEANQMNGNVMFVLMHGESYDYIGSSRLLYDMQSTAGWPGGEDIAALSLDEVSVMLELGQISLQPLYSHSVTNTTEQQAFLRELERVFQTLGLGLQASSALHLPPASLQSFLKARKDFPGILVTDHDKKYTNKFYHSIYDDAKQLQYEYSNGSEVTSGSIQSLVSNISLAVATTIYNTLTNRHYTGSVTANNTLTDELLHCYLDNTNCSLFRSATGSQQNLPNSTASHYVGVNASLNLLTVLTAQTLSLLTGVKTNASEEQCKSSSKPQVWQHTWMRGYTSGAANDSGVCVKSTVNYSPAVSPAFSIDDYSWSSGQYSTWTESIWQQFSVRMFLRASPAQEAVTLSVGTVVALLSFLVMYFVQRKADVLFADNLMTAAL